MATTPLFGLNGRRSPANLQGISENKVFLFTDEELQTDIQRQVESFQLYARRNNKDSESLPLIESKRWQGWNANIGVRIQDGPR
jgi:hypothetical protein